jgi:hypothetical protein
MRGRKTCKKCETPYKKEEHKIENYNIIITRCKCGWKLVDVIDDEGHSLKEIIDRETIERMIKSKASNISF